MLKQVIKQQAAGLAMIYPWAQRRLDGIHARRAHQSMVASTTTRYTACTVQRSHPCQRVKLGTADISRGEPYSSRNLHGIGSITCAVPLRQTVLQLNHQTDYQGVRHRPLMEYGHRQIVEHDHGLRQL